MTEPKKPAPDKASEDASGIAPERIDRELSPGEIEAILARCEEVRRDSPPL